MTTLVSDTFTRADSATTIGSPAVGPAPVVLGGVGGITGNLLYAPTAPLLVVWECGTTDVDVTVDAVGTLSNTRVLGIVIGGASLTDHYLVHFYDTYGQLWRSHPGGYSMLAQFNVGVTAAATTVRTTYRNRWIRAYISGTEVLRYRVDTPITSTRHGLRLVHAGNIRADNLLVTDTPPADPSALTGASRDIDRLDGTRVVPDGFPYRGRDLKALDTAGVA